MKKHAPRSRKGPQNPRRKSHSRTGGNTSTPPAARGKDGKFEAGPDGDDDEREAARERRRLVRFGDVLDVLGESPDAEAVGDALRPLLLFGGNSSVRVKISVSPLSAALGLGSSVAKRVRVDSFRTR